LAIGDRAWRRQTLGAFSASTTFNASDKESDIRELAGKGWLSRLDKRRI
jgi:hypothetical protein